ncbi:hypothetical protein C8Q80DRAFT_1268589 [Daedaleopsis nitida]|nr:hypothetical protein C8Q80DRAFT_1268589 [Daedaleopsis nitida]
MPAYVYPSQSSHHRQRTYSQSYYPTTTSPQIVYTSSHRSHHSSPGHGHHHSASYTQPGTYYTTPQYLTPTYQHDSGRHHHSGHGHHRTGSGGTHYTVAPVQYTSASRRSPPHHTSHHTTTVHTHRSGRSQSLPRQTPQVRSTDYAYNTGHRLRRSESRPRDTSTYNVSRQRRSTSSEPIGERIRRMFGLGGHSSGRNHRADYIDARSGRTVDWRGRPIYRV